MVFRFMHSLRTTNRQTLFTEHLQVLYTFSQTDVLYRNLKLVGNSDYNTAFSRSVQLGYSHCRNLRCQSKLLGLLKCVLSGEPSKTSNTSFGASGTTFLHYILNFGQLVHQTHFIMQTPGGIYNHHIGIIGYR